MPVAVRMATTPGMTCWYNDASEPSKGMGLEETGTSVDAAGAGESGAAGGRGERPGSWHAIAASVRIKNANRGRFILSLSMLTGIGIGRMVLPCG